MAIRKIEFTVKGDGITPATEQRIGIQGEHAASEIVFNIESGLYQNLLVKKGESNRLIYRFDIYDGFGEKIQTDTNDLTSMIIAFPIGGNITKNGGKVTVYLVVSMYDSEHKTEMDLISYPARLSFEDTPLCNSDDWESVSVLNDAAKESARLALKSATEAKTAQEKTEIAQRALEEGSEFIFDGGDSEGSMCSKVALVVDEELSVASDNPIANKAVAKKFSEMQSGFDDTVKAYIESEIAKSIADRSLKEHPVGSVCIFMSATVNPATLYGGTWERVAKGRTLIGVDEDDEDFKTPAKTGGEKNHTLIENEIPYHAHPLSNGNSWGWGNDNCDVYAPTRATAKQPGSNIISSMNYIGTNQWTASITLGTGGGGAHNNLQPYITCYIWQRTA